MTKNSTTTANCAAVPSTEGRARDPIATSGKALSGLFRFVFLISIALCANATYAQTTLATTFSNNNGSSVAVFTFQNTNAYPVAIKSIGTFAGATGTQTAQMWAKVSTANPGAPGAVSAANGWTLVASNTLATTSDATSTNGALAPTMISGMNYLVAAGAYVRICMSLSTAIRYSTVGAQTSTFSAGGCNIICGTNNGYGGTLAAPSNTPRAFMGFVNFIPALPPTITSITPSSACANNGTITINGTNFAGVTAANVQIGGTAVAAILTNTGTQITATVGAGSTGVVTVNNGVGTATGSFFIVNSNQAPTTSASATTVNAGATVSLTASGAGTNLSWYDAATGGNLLSSSATYTSPILCSGPVTYYAQQTNGSCTSNRTPVTITVNALTAPTLTPASASIAAGNTQTYTASGIGTSFTWYDAATGGNVVSNTAAFTTPILCNNTSYYVSQNVAGCPASARATAATTVSTALPAPTVSPTSVSLTNIGDIATMTASGAGTIFNWYTTATGGTPVFTGATYAPNVCNTTTYYVEQSNGVCASQARTAVTVTVAQTLATAMNPANGLICSAGGMVGLSVTPIAGATGYTWSGGALVGGINTGTNVNARPATTTIYTVAANMGFCTATASTNVGVISGSGAVPTASPSVFCSNPTSTVQLNANLSAGSFGVSAIPYAPATVPSSGVTTLCNNGTTIVPQATVSLDDGGWSSIPLGFNYNFFGTVFNTVNVGTNGVIQFGPYSGFNASQFTFSTFPSASNPSNVIAVCAMDMYLASTGSISYWNDGIAPTRRFIIQYTNVPGYTAVGSQTVQCILYETTGVVEIHVTQVTDNSHAKTIGLQNTGGTIGAAAPGRNGTVWTVATPEAWRFTPPANYTYSWDHSSLLSNATIVNPVVNAPVPAGNTTFTVTVTNPITGCVTNSSASISVGNTPPAPTCSGATVCGQGTPTLTATPANGGTLRWTAAGGGPVLATGNSYTPPTITSTTSFNVFEDGGTAVQNVGMLATDPGTTAFASSTANYQTFDVLNATGIIINTVDIVPNASTPLGTPISIELENSAGVAIGAPVSTVTTTQGTVQTITLNMFVPFGTNYQLRPVVNPNLQYHQTGFSNPYTLANQVSITGYGAPNANTLYAFFYNWSVTTSCYSAPCTSTVTVTPAPTLTITPAGTPAYCTTGSVSMTAGGSPSWTTFNWGPAAGLNTTSGATVVATPSSTTTYTVTATDGVTNGCVATATQTITVNASPVASVGTLAGPACVGTPVNINGVGAASGFKQLGTSLNTANANIAVYDGVNVNIKTQILYTAAELNAAGLFGPSNISSIGFQVSNKLSTGSLTGFTISMASVATAPPLTTTYLTPTLTTVFTGNVTTSLGWNMHTLSSPYYWDGTSNLLVQICNGTPTAAGFDQVYATPTASAQTIIGNLLGCTSATGATSNNRPNTRFVGGLVNYSWSPATDLSSSTIASPVWTPSTSGNGTYSLLVTDPANGCTATASVNATALDVPGVPVSGGNITHCGPGYVSLAATSANSTTLRFYDAATGGNLLGTGTSPFNYLATASGTVWVEGYNGTCSSSSRTSITITINAATSISAAALNSGSCATGGANNTLGASSTANYTYTWTPSTGIVSQYGAHGEFVDVHPTTTTTYTVIGDDGAGCSNLTTVVATVIPNPPAPVLTATPTQYCPGGSTTLAVTSPLSSSGYTMTSIPYAAVSPTGAASAGPVGDDVTATIPIGFNFTFYGTSYNTVYVSTNGFLSFDAAAGAGCCSGQVLPNATAPNNVIALDWMDLNTGSGGSIDYFNLTSPNRFVVRFNAVATFGASGTVSGEIILYQTGVIEIHNTSITTTGTAQTQGIENAAGTVGTAVTGRNSTAWNATSDAWRFTPLTPLSYLWTPNGASNGIPAGNQTLTSTTANPTATTQYTMQVTDSGTGCSSSSNITVTVLTNPSPPATTGGATACGSGTVTLSATPPGAGTITWYDAATGGNVIGTGTTITSPFISSTTTYYAEYNNGLCTSATRTPTVATVTPPPAVNVASSQPLLCVGGATTSTTLSASSINSNYTYFWSPSTGLNTTSGGSVVASPTTTTTYTALAFDAVSGCISQNTVQVVVGNKPNLAATATPTSLCLGNTSQLDAGGTAVPNYSWSPSSNLSASNIKNPVATLASPSQTYNVTASDAAGCSATATVTITAATPPTGVASVAGNCQASGSITLR